MSDSTVKFARKILGELFLEGCDKANIYVEPELRKQIEAGEVEVFEKSKREKRSHEQRRKDKGKIDSL